MATRRSRRFSRRDHADAANLNLQKLRQRQLPERAQAIVVNRTAGGAAVEELLDSFIASYLCGIEHEPCSFLRLISIETRAAQVFTSSTYGLVALSSHCEQPSGETGSRSCEFHTAALKKTTRPAKVMT